MKREFGFIVMTNAEYDAWYEKYMEVTENPESTDEEIEEMENMMNLIAISDED